MTLYWVIHSVLRHFLAIETIKPVEYSLKQVSALSRRYRVPRVSGVLRLAFSKPTDNDDRRKRRWPTQREIMKDDGSAACRGQDINPKGVE